MNLTAIATLLALFLSTSKRQNKENEEEDRNVVIKEEYDFIVVGAGNTGCVVAARLAELKNVTTLVLESGQSGRGDPDVDVPFFAPKLWFTERDWNMSTTPQKNLKTKTGLRSLNYFRGRVGGGSSALNFHVYIRGNEHGYKLWEDEGATGWSLDNLRKYFAKVENGVEPGMSETVYNENGKVKLTKVYNMPISNIMKNAANEIGIPTVDYLDGGGLKMGISDITKTVVDGKRQYALNSYLHPAWTTRKSSLDVAYGAHAHKILFHKVNGATKAYGVRFEHNGLIREVRARKEVIVSAGVFNTPQLLMLSGIGPKDHLEEMNIDVVEDVPGVGSNAEDHPALPIHYYGDKYPEDAQMFYNKTLAAFDEYSTNGTGPMSTVKGYTDVINIRSNSTAASSSEAYPFPDIGIQIGALGTNVNERADPNGVFETEYVEAQNNRNGVLYHFTLRLMLSHPKSKGTVRLRSADPYDLPLYDGNYYDKRLDVTIMHEGIRTAERLEQSPEFKKYGLKMVMFPDHCNMTNPNEIPRSKTFYNCYMDEMSVVYSHASCTCKMGRKNNTKAVLDHRLRLHAVSNLRVADASVMPHVTSANPQATCYVIGEKAADMIKEDWNLMLDGETKNSKSSANRPTTLVMYHTIILFASLCFF